eukprot:9453759-Alexandrium_andersonii.AAC.1
MRWHSGRSTSSSPGSISPSWHWDRRYLHAPRVRAAAALPPGALQAPSVVAQSAPTLARTTVPVFLSPPPRPQPSGALATSPGSPGRRRIPGRP